VKIDTLPLLFIAYIFNSYRVSIAYLAWQTGQRVCMKQELLRMERICKQYYGTRVLKNAGFNLFRGETLAIIGENGAGKSTLMKILCGVVQKDAGRICIRERETDISTAQSARANGLHFIMQDPALVPEFTVSENIFMFYSLGAGAIGYKRQKARELAKTLLKKMNIPLDPDAPAYKLSLSQQYMLEIAMAVSISSNVLIMDETTASLNSSDMEIVKRIINDYKKDGNSVIFVSHNIDEVLEIADRIIVLRDGMNVGNIQKKDFSKERIVRLLVGKDLSSVYQRRYNLRGKELLRLENVYAKGLNGISLSLHEGEILGITGLVGSGKTNLAYLIFGLIPYISGNVWINGVKQEGLQIKHAINKGVAFIPEDKQTHGLLNNMLISENIVAAVLYRLGIFGFIKERVKRYVASQYIKLLDIKYNSVTQSVGTLSGGNQQKVIIARWLARHPKILIADEPTMGLDMKSREEVYKVLDELVNSGVAVLLISSHIPEILQMSDRVLVLSDGVIKGEITSAELTKDSIINMEVS